MTKRQDAEFQALWNKANAAGREAATATVPQPMYVSTAVGLFSDEIDTSKPVYKVDDGLCGFAWVSVRPGTSAFARWLKYHGHGQTDGYAGGVSIWIGDYNQSHARKYAHAKAMAKVITDAGYTAYANERLD